MNRYEAPDKAKFLVRDPPFTGEPSPAPQARTCFCHLQIVTDRRAGAGPGLVKEGPNLSCRGSDFSGLAA